MRRYISPRSTATHCRGYLDPLRLLRHVTPSHAYISGRQVITAPIILSHIPPSSINNGVRELIIVRDIRPTEREALPPRIIFSCIGGAFGGGFIGLFNQLGFATGSTAIGPSGWALFPLAAGNHGIGAAIAVYGVGLVISYIAGFVLTYFFGVPKDLVERMSDEERTVESAGA